MKLRTAIKLSLGLLLGLIATAMILVARSQALSLVYSYPEERSVMTETPADYALEYEEVTVRSEGGLVLHGWYIPSRNSAAVVLQHGYKSNRAEMLEEAAVLAGQGYGALIVSVRAHDLNDGELIGFGLNEMPDLDAWYSYLERRPDVDPEKIGVLGNSLGGSMVIQYAAQNQRVKAVVAHSAFSSMRDTIDTSVTYYTDLPAFPFATLIRFWAEREIGADIDDIDASQWIGSLGPRPVLLIHSLTDVVISPASGEILFAAAGEPKLLWQEAGVGHASFDTELNEEFAERVVGFFDEYLLAE